MSDILWLDAKLCDPPHAVTHEDRLEALIESLRGGWNGPALLGYRLDDRVQLLSGSHRHAAAAYLGTAIPVVLHSDVLDRYGTDAWPLMMASAPMVTT